MRARSSALDMRLDTSIAQLNRYMIGVLNIGDEENISKVIWVDGTTGSDANDGLSPDEAKATIQAGVDAAVAYDTVAVFPGTYAEYIDIVTDHITLTGLGDTPRQVCIMDTAATTTDEMINITASYVTVSNLHVGNGHDDRVEAIVIGVGSYNIIRGCLIEPLAGVTQDEGIRIMGPNTNVGHIIEDCEFNTCTLGIVYEDAT